MPTSDGYQLYGPDEDVLLDDSFVQTHCFHLARDAHHLGQIGVGFEPTKARDALTDITGTLWLDSATVGLRSLDYAYTNWRVPMQSSTGAGGEMVFATALNGISFVSSWRLREGQRRREGQFAGLGIYGQGRGLGWILNLNAETGAQLATITWRDGTTWTANLPTVNGEIRDARTRRPRAGIPVRLLNADRVAWTDSLGHFSIPNVIAGPYLLAIEDSLIAVFRTALDLPDPRITGAKPSQAFGDKIKRANGKYDSQPLVQAIQVDSADNPPILVELPNIEEAFRRKCGSDHGADTSGVLAVWVLNEGVAAEGVPVVARWQAGNSPATKSGRSDESGRVILCGISRGAVVTLSTRFGEQNTVDRTVTLLRDRLVTMAVIAR